MSQRISHEEDEFDLICRLSSWLRGELKEVDRNTIKKTLIAWLTAKGKQGLNIYLSAMSGRGNVGDGVVWRLVKYEKVNPVGANAHVIRGLKKYWLEYLCADERDILKEVFNNMRSYTSL